MFVYISSYSHTSCCVYRHLQEKTASSAVHAVHVHSSKSTCIVLPLWLMHFMPQLARLICERLQPGRQGGQHVMKPHFFHFKWTCNWKWDENLPYLYPKRKERHDMNYNEVRQVQSISYHIYFTGSHKLIFLICRYRGFATQDGFENLRLRICLPLSCPLAIQNSSLRNPSFQVSNFPSRNLSLWQSKRLYNSSKLCHFAFELLTWQTR